MNNRVERPRREKKNSLPAVIVLALMAAVCTYILLIGMEKRALSDYEKEKVWVASKEMKANTILSENNIDSYFKIMEMDRNQIPGTAIRDINVLLGQRSLLELNAGMVVCESMFTDDEEHTKTKKNPVVVGWKAEDLRLAANGRLRAGDRVSIYSYDRETEESVCLWKDILVYQVFDSVGNEIASEDKSGVALRINLILEEKDVTKFYARMESDGILLVLEK